MTKTKKISKIIPAILLSTAMMLPTSQLTSSIVAHANESSSTAVDYTPTKTYVSDIEWENSSTTYTSNPNIQRDRSTYTSTYNGNTLTLKKDIADRTQTYEKGIGINSNQEIRIDLTKNDYHTFDANVGVLQFPEYNKDKRNSCLEFKFYLDNELVTTSGGMTYSNVQKHISFDVENAKELKIVVDPFDNSTSGDWGVLGDVKFTTYATTYSEATFEKQPTYEYSPYKKASSTIMYVGNNYPYDYFVSDIEVTFNTISNDPDKSNKESIRSIKSEKNKKFYLGSTYGSVGLGCRIRYEVKKGTRTKYYMNPNGKCLKKEIIEFETKTPVGSCEYRIVPVSQLEN